MCKDIEKHLIPIIFTFFFMTVNLGPSECWTISGRDRPCRGNSTKPSRHLEVEIANYAIWPPILKGNLLKCTKKGFYSNKEITHNYYIIKITFHN